MDNNSEVVSLYLDDIIPNRFQPREVFDDQALKELAVSIKEHGVIQPIIVRKVENKYEIIAGERRYKAATMAGLTKIPAIVKNLDDKESSKIALIENLQRKDLTPIEEARTYQKILELEEGSMTQEQLAATMGKTQSSVSNKLRLLALPEEIQDALLKEKISERHARSLLNVEDKNLQIKLLDKIVVERMTVRDLDKEIRELKEGKAGAGDMSLDIDLNLEPNEDSGKGLLTAADIANDQKAASFGGQWTLQDKTADLNTEENKEEKPAEPVEEKKEEKMPSFSTFGLFRATDEKKEDLSTKFNFGSFSADTTPASTPATSEATTEAVASVSETPASETSHAPGEAPIVKPSFSFESKPAETEEKKEEETKSPFSFTSFLQDSQAAASAQPSTTEVISAPKEEKKTVELLSMFSSNDDSKTTDFSFVPNVDVDFKDIAPEVKEETKEETKVPDTQPEILDIETEASKPIEKAKINIEALLDDETTTNDLLKDGSKQPELLVKNFDELFNVDIEPTSASSNVASSISSSSIAVSGKKDVSKAVTDIKNTIKTLESNGYKVLLEEQDNASDYKITITLGKDA